MSNPRDDTVPQQGDNSPVQRSGSWSWPKFGSKGHSSSSPTASMDQPQDDTTHIPNTDQAALGLCLGGSPLAAQHVAHSVGHPPTHTHALCFTSNPDAVSAVKVAALRLFLYSP